MAPHTPATEFFCELSDVQSLIMDVLTAPDLHIKHWPTYYRLYIDVDELAWRVYKASQYLTERFVGEDGTFAAQLVEAANECLAGIGDCQRRIVDWISKMTRQGWISCNDKALTHHLRCHLQPKSAWYQEFHERYCAGKISEDGQILSRFIFRIDPDPTYRIPDLDEKQLAQQQVFDVATEKAIASLVLAAEQVSARIGEVRASMGDYFVRHCTPEDLLHPSWV